MNGKVDVFLEKDGERKEVAVEKVVGKGGPRFVFAEKKPEQRQQQPEEKGDDEPTTEDAGDESTTEVDPVTEVVPGMSEDEPDEREPGQKMWLVDKVTTLEKENGELKRALQELETRLAVQESSTRQVNERCVNMETAITKIAEFVQQQNTDIENLKGLMNNIVEEIKIHRDRFQKMAMVMQVHEQHIVQSGAVTQEMAQYINALIQDNLDKTMQI